MSKTKVRVRAIFEEGQFFVFEEILHDGFVSDRYRHGPFETSFEADAYSEQRSHWLQNKVKPSDNRTAEPFTFIFPPP